MARLRFDELVEEVRTRLPACGATTVVAVDGPSGSGKSEVADRLGRRLDATVLRVDDFVPGWRGLAAMPPALARDLLAPLAAGAPASIRPWHWHADRWGEPVAVKPAAHLVLDGCGSGSRVIRPFLSLLVWVDAPAEVRHARAMARDGDVYGPWWDVWAEQERALFAAEQTEAAADVRFRSA